MSIGECYARKDKSIILEAFHVEQYESLLDGNVKVDQISIYESKVLCVTINSHSGTFALTFDESCQDVQSVVDLARTRIITCESEVALFEQIANIVRRQAADFAVGPIKLFEIQTMKGTMCELHLVQNDELSHILSLA